MGKATKKRTWRKADIADVEEGLEEARAVKKLKRQGAEGGAKEGGEGELDELFTIDTAGSGEGLSKKTKRELARARLFPNKGPNLGLSAAEEMKVEKHEAKLDAPPNPKSSPPKVIANYDLWSAPAPSNSTLPLAAKNFAQLRGRKYAATKVPKTLNQKVSTAPAVVPAHEGQSMNPELGAYEDVACAAAAVQLEKERVAEEINRKIKPMTHELRDTISGEEWKEMSEEDKVQKFRALICKSGTGDAGAATGKPASHIKHRHKSQAHKNRDAAKKVQDEHERAAKQQDKLERSVGDLGAIMKELKQREAWEKDRRDYRESRKAAAGKLEKINGIVPKRRRLGTALFEENAQHVPDAAAAAKGLRAMPLKSSALQERVASIMRRGMLPATPEATHADLRRRGKAKKLIAKRRKPISPLLRDNLMLR
jgi:hypothetical protein